MRKLNIVLLSAGFALSGCVKAATTTVGAAGKTSAKTTMAVVAPSSNSAANHDGDSHKGEKHHGDNPRPFDAARNAQQDVDIALASARASGKNALLVFGGNWCHDSRGLAAKFEAPALAAIIEDHYVLTWIDVGRRDRNLDVLRGVGVDDIYGTPTVVILSPNGEIINEDSVHDWRTADSKSFEETYDYFVGFAGADIEPGK
ncbi:MAG: thioredoxin family protein [Marinicaulis sp.]|nr:thioredoxin family protein [Marinicaulis sp.]